MMYDQRFYDRNNNCYTIDKILVEGQKDLEGMILLYCGMPTLVLVLTQEINLISIEICRVD